MSLFIFRFWPVLIPLLIYWLWHLRNKNKAKKAGSPPPRFRDGPWYWAIIAALVTAFGCFVFIGLSGEHTDGRYVPPTLKDGKVVPGHIEP
ncbi:MAG: hypothetical protein ACN2B6_08845 [Rickettsiales bacterium]